MSSLPSPQQIQSSPRRDHPDTGTSLNNLAEVYRLQRNYTAAEPLYKEALKVKERAHNPHDPNISATLNNLALLYLAQGNDSAAAPLYQRALKINEEAFGPDRLLFGTGYPGAARAAYQRPTLAEEIDLIEKQIPFFSRQDRAKILGLNAAKLWAVKS